MKSKKNSKIITDEWGDEGNWETIVDFRDLPNGGMPIDEFINILEKINDKEQKNEKPQKKKTPTK